jgi:hypothetical protein
MKKIGIISDTHGYLSDEIFDFFNDVDEIWHAGDIGSLQIVEKLSNFKKFRAVYGNIDGQDIRAICPQHQIFLCENAKIWITHIGGYPGKYNKLILNQIPKISPDLLVCGHSHILKVIYDKKFNLLHINPGAFGISGFHKKRTAIKLYIDNKKFKNLEILELNKFKNS